MLAVLLASFLLPQAAQPAYDPLATAAGAGASLALVAHDAARTRDVPLRVWLPPVPAGATAAPAPVILWSHGLGGSRDNSPYLGKHWSARGYVVVCMQHAGSDESVWRDVPLRERMDALRKAASAANYGLRGEDVKFVLDQLTLWNRDAGHELHGRLDLDRVGMTGHSFGAVTTQAVSGQGNALQGQKHRDPRIDAALPMSPSVPKLGDPKRAFGDVGIPWLLMTGTADGSPIGDIEVADRLAVYPALPASIDRYELVLDGAEHSAFGERALPGERAQRNPNHHRAILALSTAFWDAHLRGDAAARDWLHGDGPRRVLEPKDRWQCAAGAATPARR